jgi:hypothetical protein
MISVSSHCHGSLMSDNAPKSGVTLIIIVRAQMLPACIITCGPSYGMRRLIHFHLRSRSEASFWWTHVLAGKFVSEYPPHGTARMIGTPFSNHLPGINRKATGQRSRGHPPQTVKSRFAVVRHSNAVLEVSPFRRHADHQQGREPVIRQSGFSGDRRVKSASMWQRCGRDTLVNHRKMP